MNPERWTIDGVAYREANERLQALIERVGEDARPCRAEIPSGNPPAYFDDYCRRHFIALRMHRPAVQWQDVVPLYALTATLHRPDTRQVPASCAQLLESHYESLRGGSRLEWSQAKALIEETWPVLTILQGNPHR